MSTDIPSNIITLTSNLKVKSASLPVNAKEFGRLPEFSEPPAFLQTNKLLRIQILIQINRLVSELVGSDRDELLKDQADKKAAYKILILQLRIELIRLESKIEVL